MRTVNDLMTVNPTTISPNESLRTIIGMMKSEGYRQLPVVDQGKLIGMVTDRDVRLVINSPMVLHDREQDEALLDKITAEGCMTPNPITVSPNTPVHRAAEMLSVYKFGALPVIENNVVVGIISVTDFLNYVAKEARSDVISS
jgi:CBS domain-containing protein